MKPTTARSSRRTIPSVDAILREIGQTGLPRPVLVAIIRRELALLRLRYDRHEDTPTVDFSLDPIRAAVEDLRRAKLAPIINGTGIIIHTNFGRSPLGAQVVRAIAEAAASYTNLEFDLVAGERGGRAYYLEHNLAILCGAQAATIVNNCAAALVLILRHVASTAPKTKVLVSRGELMQIGGGFRIPDILQASGCVLREVGTTNKTLIEDYHRAIDEQTALILRIHQSNFYMGGFVASTSLTELAALARQSQIPLVYDIGSGACFDTTTLGGNEHEPTAGEAIRDGATLVTFSGDKLLGGPQAGIIAGRGDLIASLKKDPFFRALRCDKLILSALQASTDLLLNNEKTEIPIRAMMEFPIAALRARAAEIINAVSSLPITATFCQSEAQVGGGSLARTVIPSVAVSFSSSRMKPQALQTAMRSNTPPIVGYIASDHFRLDLRTVFPHQDAIIIEALRAMTTKAHA